MSARLLQSAALATYRHPMMQRFTRTRLGSAIFVWAYDVYKELVEAPGNHALRRWIPPRRWAIDIGANVGFFTERFATWVSDGGRVIAVEPETRNLALLKQRLARRSIESAVDVHAAAATERPGTVYLKRNLDHPGDHRLSDVGEAIASVTVDDIVEQAGNPDIALIKIDTQGSERRVLQGAAKTLQRCKPTLFIEVDDGALRQFGTSREEVLRELNAHQYKFYRISRFGREVQISLEQALGGRGSDARGYDDLLCVHQENVLVL
jgi:FkbM family methyltransferase